MNLASIMLGMIGPWQIVLIVAAVLLLFGGRKIPELMRGLGSGIKEFKDASKYRWMYCPHFVLRTKGNLARTAANDAAGSSRSFN